MPAKRLTAITAANIKAPAPGPEGQVRQVDYWDKLDGGGTLGLRVSSNGVRSWAVFPRVLLQGKHVKVWITLGRFPDISLAEAREKASAAFALARQGKDPREALKDERQAVVDESRNTFGALADEFLTKHVDVNLEAATGKEYRRALKGTDLAEWQSRCVSEIRKRDVVALVDSIVASGRRVWANRMLAYVRRFFVWCAERDILELLPTDHVRPPTDESGRERALSTPEMKEVWAAFDAHGGLFGSLFKLLLLTGQRREEVAGMRWEELHGLGTAKAPGGSPSWELPGERTKNGLPHVVPLAPAAADLIRAMPRLARSPFVFTTTGKSPVSGFSRVRERLDVLIAKTRKKAGIVEPMEPWVTHDLRRTVVTRMNEDLRILPHVVEAVVNHVSGAAKRGVAGTYNKAQYLDDKRRALTTWADYVERLVAPAKH